MQGEAAKLLSERRHALGLTQHQVAQLAGVREYDVSRWERGKTRALPLLGIWKISRALEIPLQDVAKAMEADELAAAPPPAPGDRRRLQLALSGDDD